MLVYAPFDWLGFKPVWVIFSAAGKTGTAEYCDKYANAKNLCIPGNWPTHAWTVAFAPYENPQIAVVEIGRAHV